ncbi:pleiotropic drug resistance protein 7 [Dorcoceras hygrometricum]|uniref:Pleiotropic drug resistance protein 7 n=1 Tax=Dorcoceras hygrometricum TaxID=472368 RepID=A0A2Z7ACZ2_9LAMI|nr:pleiotropic drug resistance protein 7 [Dorcoceras hygrometricum]
MPPRRRGRASRQVVVDSRIPVSADREDASQTSVPLGFSESQSSAFLALANAVNRAVDLMESLVVGQTRVQQSTGQSVDHVPSGTSSSHPSVASQSLSRQRLDLEEGNLRDLVRVLQVLAVLVEGGRLRHFVVSVGVSINPPTALECEALVIIVVVGHYARVCPTLGQLDLISSSSRRPNRPSPSQRSEFQPLETSSVRELSLFEQPGLQPTQVDATTGERDDILTGGDCTDSSLFLPRCKHLFREAIRCRFVKSEYLMCGRDLMSTLVKVPVARCGYAVVFVRSGCLRPDFTVVLCDVVLELIAGLRLVGEIRFAGVSIQTSTLVNSPVAIVVVCVACSNFSAFILQTSSMVARRRFVAEHCLVHAFVA